jgi:hypothetical protein
LAFIIVAGIVTHPDIVSVSDEKYADMHGALDQFTPTIKEDMNEIFSLTEATARNLSGVSMGDSSVELALLQLRRDIPASYDTYIVDTGNNRDLRRTEIRRDAVTRQYHRRGFEISQKYLYRHVILHI